MTIKTVCALTLKQDAISGSYTDYEIYPLASMFTDSNDNAIISYMNKMTSIHIEIQECAIMEALLENGETLRFYKVKGRNTTFNHVGVRNYLVIDVPFIDD